MSYSKLFLLFVGLALLRVDWWKGVAIVFVYIAISFAETWNRERLLKKILDNEFDRGWTTYEHDSELEVKGQLARVKLSNSDNAVVVRLAQIAYRIAVI